MPTRFVGGIKEKIAHLINVISLKNKSQQSGGHLKEFVDLVNQQAHHIGRLTFVDTRYLHRHYTPHYGIDAQAIDQDWALSNHATLIRLQKDYKILSWGTVVHSEAYARYLAIVTQDYHTDSVFATHINNAVKQHQNKGDSDSVLRYVLDECAGTLTLVESDVESDTLRVEKATLTYPGKLNKPVHYTLQKHFSGNTSYFLDYKLDTKAKERAPFHSDFWQSPDTTQVCYEDEQFNASIGRLLCNGLPAKPALRRDFLSDLVRLCDHYNKEGIETPTLR